MSALPTTLLIGSQRLVPGLADVFNRKPQGLLGACLHVIAAFDHLPDGFFLEFRGRSLGIHKLPSRRQGSMPERVAYFTVAGTFASHARQPSRAAHRHVRSDRNRSTVCADVGRRRRLTHGDTA